MEKFWLKTILPLPLPHIHIYQQSDILLKAFPSLTLQPLQYCILDNTTTIRPPLKTQLVYAEISPDHS